MKTITTIYFSEYRKLSSFDRKLLKFFYKRNWMVYLIPLSFAAALYITVMLNTILISVAHIILFFLLALYVAEKYGKLSDTTEYCDCGNKLKYLGQDYYATSEWYLCEKCEKEFEQ